MLGLMVGRRRAWRVSWLAGLMLLCPLAVCAASLERLVMPGPLSAAHAHIEDSCDGCHAPLEDKSQRMLCTQCHEDVGGDMDDQRGFHGRHPQVGDSQCQSCHAEHEGRDASTLQFDLERFDHAHTDFLLEGAHIGLSCGECHEGSAKYRDAPSTCVMCHADDDPHQRQLGGDCAACHGQQAWQIPTFDHAATGFALTHGHAQVSCNGCHTDATFAETPTQCAGCHADDDVHGGSFGQACDQCHSTGSWIKTAFDHHMRTGFALRGGHANLSCDACHGSRPLSALSGASCSACHAKDDAHGGAFGSACETCHSEQTWTQSRFDHGADTGFALLGSHAKLACRDCHLDASAGSPGTACADCHADPHAGQLAGACDACHGQTDFHTQVVFDHGLTAFPLLGQHAALTCVQCHASSRFHDTGSTCASCHADEDVHAGRLGAACGDCHNPTGWTYTTFDHGEVAQFPLLGAHKGLRCESCHARAVLMQAASAADCVQCHRSDDAHQGRFGIDCGRCHLTDTFSRIKRF